MKIVRICFALVFLLLAVLPASAQQPVQPAPTDDPNTIEINPEQAAEDVIDATQAVAETTATALDRFLDRLTTVPRSDVARILLVIGGVVLLIAGWSIYEFIILLAGFLIGASIGVSLFEENNAALQLVGLLLGGLLGVALAALLYYVAVFLMGAYLGIVLTSAAAVTLEVAPVSPLVLLLAGLIGGMVLLALSFEFLILLSALVGAQMLSLGLGLGPIWTLVFFVVGVVIQLVATRYYGRDLRRRPVRVVHWPRRRRA